MIDIPDIKTAIPGELLILGRRVLEKGGELFIVGGWIRDLLRTGDVSLHRNDIDLATSLSPSQIKTLAGDSGKPFNLGERFGTVGIKTADHSLEITTFRSDEYGPGSRHPAVKPVNDIAEDLLRRDFTINAIAVDVARNPGRIIDPYNGIEDIERRTIRTPGDPAVRMSEDPLRMMRAVRFASQLDYEIERSLCEVLKDSASLLEQISWERRREELEKILVSASPDSGISKMVETGLMDHVIPEVSEMRGVEQPEAYHRADVLGHTLLMMKCLEPDPLLRRSALFHDVGKPDAKVTEPKVRFPLHDRIGEETTKKAMKRLKYSNLDIQKTAFLVRYHMRPIYYEDKWSGAAVRRFIRDCTMTRGDEVLITPETVLDLARADIRAGNLEKSGQFLKAVDELEIRIRTIGFESGGKKPGSPLNGKELIAEFKRKQGPWIKDIKSYLEEMVINGELKEGDKKEGLRLARAYFKDKLS
ncbi:MAG: HD domain-containing protein [Actinobacteria bacterium]|nr:HD domain-containing protein [Actinomycetota bacterium]